MVDLNVVLIFQIFNGPRGLVDALSVYQSDVVLPYSTVQMWSQRRQIPGKYTGAVLFCCLQKGVPLETLLIDETQPSAAGAAALGL